MSAESSTEPNAALYYRDLIALLDAGGRPTAENFASMCHVFRAAGYRATTHPTSPSAQCRGEGRGGAVSEGGGVMGEVSQRWRAYVRWAPGELEVFVGIWWVALALAALALIAWAVIA